MDVLFYLWSRLSKSSGPDGGGLSLEYLKNVVLRYMLSSDAGDREHMLKAGQDAVGFLAISYALLVFNRVYGLFN